MSDFTITNKTHNPDVDWVMTEQKLLNQLQAARYVVHKLRLKEAHDAWAYDGLEPDKAKEMYREGMANFEDVIKGAINGSFADAIEREMTEFDINGVIGG